MIYISAIYANAEHTQVIGTDADGNTETVALDHKLFRQPEHGPQGFLKAGGKIEDYVAPAAPTGYRLYKSTFIGRMTANEAETMEAVLAAADAKLRLLFNSVEYFVSDNPLFSTLMQAVSAVLGEKRAKELLAE